MYIQVCTYLIRIIERMISVEKTRRMRRIFKKDGKTFIVAMDHGTVDGALPGIEKPGETIEKIIKGGADAVIVNVGVAKKFADKLTDIGLILRLDVPPTFLNEGHETRLIYEAEYALKLGADAVIVYVGVGKEVENTAFSALGRVVKYCDEVGLPVCAEVVPGGFDGDISLRTLDNIAKTTRIVCELGADFIKAPYVKGFEKVTQETFCPIVILGGPKKEDEMGFLAMISDSISEGGKGVAMGRNIWGHRDPLNMTRAVAALIHQGIKAEEAYQILKGAN